MTESEPVSLYFQVEAVLEAARRANTGLTDAMIIWSEGDWRVQQIKKRFEHLAAAAETLKALFEAEQLRAHGEEGKTSAPTIDDVPSCGSENDYRLACTDKRIQP